MALPPVDRLYEHLCFLRDAEDPCDPRHEGRWREVARWLEQAFPGTKQETEDARQEALISLIRHIQGMRAEGPLQAAKWIATIVRRKRVDAIRARARDPVQSALITEPRREDATPRIDRLADERGAPPNPRALSALVSTVLEHVHRELEETEKNAARRQLRRTQAHATLLRLVCDADVDAIAGALDHGEPLGNDRIYKWVERGRKPVALGLDRWERSLDDEGRAEDGPVIAILRELVDERRADAGLPRPDRRKDRPEETP